MKSFLQKDFDEMTTKGKAICIIGIAICVALFIVTEIFL